MISKTDYITYLKHPAWLWLRKQDADFLPTPDDNSVAIIDEGREFEKLAEQTLPDATHLDRSNYAGIEKVLAQIEAIKDELPDNVCEFYLEQSVNKVQEFVTQLTFMQSVHVALDKSNIDEKEYSPVIKGISTARQRIVHSQGYGGQLFIDQYKGWFS